MEYLHHTPYFWLSLMQIDLIFLASAILDRSIAAYNYLDRSIKLLMNYIPLYLWDNHSNSHAKGGMEEI